MTPTITEADLVPFDGEEPRIHDLVLAERLEFGTPSTIRQLIRRHQADLTRYGTVFSSPLKTSSTGGRPGREYFLNEGQALRLCTLSRTDKAAEITHDIITVYQTWRRGQAPRRMSPPEVMEMMQEAVARQMPAIAESVADLLRPAIGGMMKGISGRLNDEMKAELVTKFDARIEALIGSHDHHRNWAIDFKSMRTVLNDEGVPSKKRRGLSTQCSNRCFKWAKLAGRDREWKFAAGGDEAKRIFHVDLVRDWLAAEGRQIIRAHQDRVAGQTVLNLVPKDK